MLRGAEERRGKSGEGPERHCQRQKVLAKMHAEEVSRVHLPHLPKLVHVDAVPLLDVQGSAVDGDLQAELEKHGREEESRACHGVVVGVKAVSKVEGEAVRAHEEVGNAALVGCLVGWLFTGNVGLGLVKWGEERNKERGIFMCMSELAYKGKGEARCEAKL